MRKKKVLFVTEASFHPTGYSVYTKEVLKRLHKHPELEVAELASFTGPEAPELKDIPWKVYPNVPSASNQEHMNYYNSTMTNKFGEFSFNHVLLDFQPDFVMDIRDWWMLEFEERSPFRQFFNWAIMPTVDAEPQNVQWIDTYCSADAVFAYSEFGRDTMLNQSENIKFVDIASPCASENFKRLDDKKQLRKEFGLDENAIIFGTVMRNQRRKLYPDLFKAFRLFLDKNPDIHNCYLYCHTSYPDVGWDIPDLIKTYGLSNKVLMTYKCRGCNTIKSMHFNDAVVYCSQCKSFSCSLVGISNKIDEFELNKVIKALKNILNINFKNKVIKIVNDNLPFKSSVFYIGKAQNYYLALEAALKLKEISYIHTEGFAAGELKHGTIALIEPNTPVVVFISGAKNIVHQTKSAINELLARKANIIKITNISKLVDNKSLIVDYVHPLLDSLVLVVPSQLIALYTATKLNKNVDKPRNLAKSVTVE
jgi:glycosyltransferase involved in cell wall biosynthesis